MAIPIYKYNQINKSTKAKLFNRSSSNYEQVKKIVEPLMDDVKIRGDQAIYDDFKSRNITVTDLKVNEREFEEAYKAVNKDFLQAFQTSKKNLSNFCKRQKISMSDNSLSEKNGIKVWREWRPLSSVGIYVPGSRANYPSTLLMCAIPAQVAGCSNITVCSPPDELGNLPAEVLVTARELGIDRIYKIGGSQAIAAMSYGTQTVNKVQKIVGPGNQYVNAAKLMVYPQTAIDLPAGPSENMIIADDSAVPSWVAADLITDLEHGSDSTAILITDSNKLAQKVDKEITKILPTLSTRGVIKEALNSYSAIILVDSVDQAVELANDYAPEHIQIMTTQATKIAKKINCAGSVFIGDWSAKAGGDYASGANHVLPTGQTAKAFSALSVDDFGKWVEFQYLSKSGFTSIADSITTYATIENLPAHKLSAEIRKNYEK